MKGGEIRNDDKHVRYLDTSKKDPNLCVKNVSESIPILFAVLRLNRCERHAVNYLLFMLRR